MSVIVQSSSVTLVLGSELTRGLPECACCRCEVRAFESGDHDSSRGDGGGKAQTEAQTEGDRGRRCAGGRGSCGRMISGYRGAVTVVVGGYEHMSDRWTQHGEGWTPGEMGRQELKGSAAANSPALAHHVWRVGRCLAQVEAGFAWVPRGAPNLRQLLSLKKAAPRAGASQAVAWLPKGLRTTWCGTAYGETGAEPVEALQHDDGAASSDDSDRQTESDPAGVGNRPVCVDSTMCDVRLAPRMSVATSFRPCLHTLCSVLLFGSAVACCARGLRAFLFQ